MNGWWSSFIELDQMTYAHLVRSTIRIQHHIFGNTRHFKAFSLRSLKCPPVYDELPM